MDVSFHFMLSECASCPQLSSRDSLALIRTAKLLDLPRPSKTSVLSYTMFTLPLGLSYFSIEETFSGHLK